MSGLVKFTESWVHRQQATIGGKISTKKKRSWSGYKPDICRFVYTNRIFKSKILKKNQQEKNWQILAFDRENLSPYRLVYMCTPLADDDDDDADEDDDDGDDGDDHDDNHNENEDYNGNCHPAPSR